VREDEFVRDIRHAVRGLMRQRSHTAAVLTTLGLGIGATTAIFSVVSGLLLRPLPFADPERLFQMYGTSALFPQGDAVVDVTEYRSTAESLDGLVAYETTAGYVTHGSGPERVMTVRAESGFFAMLGIEPLLGRVFDGTDPATVVVVGESFWRERLGGDRSAIGRTIDLDEQPYTLIGVMPASFQFPYRAASLLPGAGAEARTDLWRPLYAGAGGRGRIGNVTGRLKAGVTLAAAEGELKRIAARLAEREPERHGGRSVQLVPLANVVVPASVRRPLLMLFAAVGLVLGLACANVTNLSLVRAALRAREIAVRSALGASRLHLIRPFLIESFLLSVLGGGLGLALAWWGTERVMRVAQARIPRAHEVGVDWRVFAFLLAVCALAAAVAGLAPALFAVRKDTRTVLQESGGAITVGTGQRRVRCGLVVAEVALAFVLAVGALLLVREFARLRDTDTGMRTRHVVTFHLGRRVGPADDGRRFYEIADRVAALPGISAAGFTQLLPLQNWGWTSNSTDFTQAGQPPQLPEFPIELRYVTPGYFDALGIAIRGGRGFTSADDRDAPPVIMINETLANLYFGADDPVGTRMNRGTIIGVVADVRQTHLDRPASPELYFPVAQNWSQVAELGMSLVVRTGDRPGASTEAIRSVIRDTDPGLAVFGVRTMDGVVAESLSDFTLYLALMTAFAVIALVLALTGTYGVVSSITASRTSEFAIRLALGADAKRVTRLVVAHGLGLTVLGLGLGLLALLAAAPLLQGLPVTVRPPDIKTAAPVAMVIVAVAVTACLIPAKRAACIAPAAVLRS
jgi:predicted permease